MYRYPLISVNYQLIQIGKISLIQTQHDDFISFCSTERHKTAVMLRLSTIQLFVSNYRKFIILSDN